jgi:hypothetical protein
MARLRAAGVAAGHPNMMGAGASRCEAGIESSVVERFEETVTAPSDDFESTRLEPTGDPAAGKAGRQVQRDRLAHDDPGSKI